MKVLVACEFTGTVRNAFTARGYDAWSCDLQPSESPGNHIQGDVTPLRRSGEWDMLIAHPPCGKLSYAGNRWLKEPGRWEEIHKALAFFRLFLEAPIPRIAVENPKGWSWKFIRKPDQIIDPYEFGHREAKATCLWLKNLPPLFATLIHSEPEINWTRNGIMGAHNGKNRSRTFPGIADAMANQWGAYNG